MGYVIEDGYYRPSPQTFVIAVNYFDGVWKHEEIVMPDERYIVAATETSRIAKELDEKYGDSHFWNVTLKNEKRDDFFQLFHGRLE